jgi:PDZ domain
VKLTAFLLFFCLLPFPAFAQDLPVLPTNPGFYILSKDAYQPLLPVPIQSMQPKVGRAILNSYSLGLAGNRMVIILPGKTSPVQTGGRPTFVLVGTSRAIASSTNWLGGLNPRALEVVKLDKKKSHREVNIMHGTSWNPSIGLPDAKWPFTITPVGDSVYQFTLPSDLEPGEYLVLSGMIANGYNGFDFTVNAEIQNEAPARQSASPGEGHPPVEPHAASSPLPNSSPATVVPQSVVAISTVRDKTTPAVSPTSPPEEMMGISFGGNPYVRHDGVEISGVQTKGSASRVDIRPGDFILAIDDHYLFTVEEVRTELLRHEPGTRVKIRYRRNQLIYEDDLVLRTPTASSTR